jgi:hypothetical protein
MELLRFFEYGLVAAFCFLTSSWVRGARRRALQAHSQINPRVSLATFSGTNRLTAVLKQYYPQILDHFLKQHRCGGFEKVEQRWQQIQSAIPATKDLAVLRSFSLTAKCLVRLLR